MVALQTLPKLLLGPYGGLIADRLDKRKLMVGLQTLMGVQAVILGVLTLTHRVTFVDVCILAVVLGLNNCFENPARQAFVLEMVGAGQPAQRGQPQLDARERRARRRPGRSRAC